METKRAGVVHCTKDNSAAVSSKYSDNWERFKPFAKRYEGKCLQLDGIADIHIWNEQKCKVLYVLKDGYRKGYTDFISTFVFDCILSEKGRPDKVHKTWTTVFDWHATIRKALGISKDNNLTSAAYINVSKLACDGNVSTVTRPRTLPIAVEEDGALLKDQLEGISPNIIVCGNTGRYLFEILGVKNRREFLIGSIGRQEDGRNPLDLYIYNNYVIFNAYHPSYLHTTKPEEFEGLILANNKAILDVINKQG